MRRAGMLGLMSAATLAAVSASMTSELDPHAPVIEPRADEPPRRLSVENGSPYYDTCVKRVEVLFDGVRRQGDVVEYDADAGWIRVHQRNHKNKIITDPTGRAVTRTLYGRVEPYFRVGEFRQVAERQQTAAAYNDARFRKAEEKRARKAAKRAAQACE